MKRNEQSLLKIWDYVKILNLHLIGVPEEDGETNIQIQEIQKTPQRYSSRSATSRHIIIRFTRVEMKEKMLRAAKEKVQVTHKGKPIRLTVDLLAVTSQKRVGTNIQHP